jgi:hypothetical protein
MIRLRICIEGARVPKERDHELFEYGVLVTHMSSKYATFEKEKPWQDGQCSLVAHMSLKFAVFECEK